MVDGRHGSPFWLSAVYPRSTPEDISLFDGMSQAGQRATCWRPPRRVVRCLILPWWSVASREELMTELRTKFLFRPGLNVGAHHVVGVTPAGAS
jgi:hypothetical protein